MNDSDMVKRAIHIAFEAHEAQVDKAGQAYILHPLFVARHMSTQEEVCTALLHDVIEDTGVTFEMLYAQGFPLRVLNALSLLTHEPEVDYFDYIEAIKASPLAAKVKLADLRHNSDETRLDTVDEKTLARMEKYKKAVAVLSLPAVSEANVLGTPGTRYFIINGTGIMKLQGHSVFSLTQDGEFVPNQYKISVFVDGMDDYEQVGEAFVSQIIACRKNAVTEHPDDYQTHGS